MSVFKLNQTTLTLHTHVITIVGKSNNSVLNLCDGGTTQWGFNNSQPWSQIGAKLLIKPSVTDLAWFPSRRRKSVRLSWYSGLNWSIRGRNPLSYETNVACIDKLASMLLLACVRVKCFISFVMFLFEVMTEGCDSPGHPVCKLYNIIFSPWSLVIICEVPF